MSLDDQWNLTRSHPSAFVVRIREDIKYCCSNQSKTSLLSSNVCIMEIKSSNAVLSSACIILCFYSSMFAFKLSRFIKRVNIDLRRNSFCCVFSLHSWRKYLHWSGNPDKHKVRLCYSKYFLSIKSCCW